MRRGISLLRYLSCSKDFVFTAQEKGWVVDRGRPTLKQQPWPAAQRRRGKNCCAGLAKRARSCASTLAARSFPVTTPYSRLSASASDCARHSYQGRGSQLSASGRADFGTTSTPSATAGKLSIHLHPSRCDAENPAYKRGGAAVPPIGHTELSGQALPHVLQSELARPQAKPEGPCQHGLHQNKGTSVPASSCTNLSVPHVGG